MSRGQYRGQRTRLKVVVLDSRELTEALNCQSQQLESELKKRKILFHKDLRGRIYASLPAASGQQFQLEFEAAGCRRE